MDKLERDANQARTLTQHKKIEKMNQTKISKRRKISKS